MVISFPIELPFSFYFKSTFPLGLKEEKWFTTVSYRLRSLSPEVNGNGKEQRSEIIPVEYLEKIG
ncbi:MAG: hypothetical protein ISR61_04730 [Desulfobacteraceae bacterium]|nr:hypothetical protein [Desulfobacteraceae bacterium]